MNGLAGGELDHLVTEFHLLPGATAEMHLDPAVAHVVAGEVLEASDGEEALKVARREKPDLIVLDVMMPGMSGWEVCRAVREDDSLSHTGVVMLTGIGERLNEMTSPLYGADEFLDKPFELGDLDDKIKSVLKKKGH